MNHEPSADEKPKRRIAREVIAEKRQYFVPVHGVSVEATDPQDAVKQAKKLIKSKNTEKGGDV